MKLIFKQFQDLLLCFQFFNNALMLGKSSESEVSDRLYDLIYELNQISPNVLLSVLPQLEFKLKVKKNSETCKNNKFIGLNGLLK